MQEFREKRQLRRMMTSRFSLVLLGVIILFLCRGVYNIYQKYSEAAQNRDAAKRQLADLSSREQFLTGEIDRLKSARGVEQEIRQKFNVKKDGEEVVVIVDATTDKNVATPSSSGVSLWHWVTTLFTRN